MGTVTYSAIQNGFSLPSIILLVTAAIFIFRCLR